MSHFRSPLEAIYSDTIALGITIPRELGPRFMGHTRLKLQLQVPLNASLPTQLSRYPAIAQIQMDTATSSHLRERGGPSSVVRTQMQNAERSVTPLPYDEAYTV